MLEMWRRDIPVRPSFSSSFSLSPRSLTHSLAHPLSLVTRSADRQGRHGEGDGRLEVLKKLLNGSGALLQNAFLGSEQRQPPCLSGSHGLY
jgi:hypothetical protein